MHAWYSDRHIHDEHHGALSFAVRRLSCLTSGIVLTRDWDSFLMTLVYTGFAIFIGWQSNIIPSPPAKRAVALALTNSISNLGNIVGS